MTARLTLTVALLCATTSWAAAPPVPWSEQQRASLRRADALNSQVLRLQSQGKAREAVALAVEVRKVRGEILGEKHPGYATSCNNLAALYRGTGEYAKALPLYEEALRAYEGSLGKRHLLYANALSNLAHLHRKTGADAKALPLAVEALRITEEVGGKRHPLYATRASNLSLLYLGMGESAKALALGEEARATREEVVGKRHPDYADSLDNLAAAYHGVGEYAKALPLSREALRLRAQVQGKKHPDYATSLNNLAALHRAAGDYAEALPLYREALSLTEQTQGKAHPDYATSLSNLALLHLGAGEHDEALPLFEEALRLREQALGKRHPHYAASLNNMAGLYRAAGEDAKAAGASAQAMRAFEGHLDDSFDHLGERQRNQAVQRVLHNLGGLLSFQESARTPAAERYAPVLAWKGRVASRGELDRAAADGASAESVGELRAARTRLARLALLTPPPARQAAWLRQVGEATEKKEALEAELARLSSRFRADREAREADPNKLAARLPAGVAFVDLVEYEHYFGPKDGKRKGKSEPRLLAFVSRKGEEVAAVPLGEQKPVAEAVVRWRAEVEKPPAKTDGKVIAAASVLIRERVWDPLAKRLGDAKTVVVAPDGVLTQFPFAALPGSKPGAYLIEEVALAQVASGAQLFALLAPPGEGAKKGKGLVAAGGIDYGPGDAYAPLPGTGPEARRCRQAYLEAFGGGAALLEGEAATPAALRRAAAARPKYLHLATHGYFEPAEKVVRQLKGLSTQEDRFALRLQTDTISNVPGLRCGLALSGANAAPPADDPDALPNVLTGDELAQLDLRGCEVAVLSACQTALGDVQRTQGVVGLQRALHAAGVRTTVTSLWCVQDAATAELMDEFYKNLWGKQKLSRLEALRRAQLTILHDPERVRKRSEALYADARKRGLGEAALRGIKGRLATDLPEGGKVEDKPKTSPEAWWAAFVLCGDWR